MPMDTNLPNNNRTQILCLRTLKRNGTNELIYETETDSQLENEIMVGGGGGGKDGEKGS